jgi:hypothetical protein
LWFCHSISLQSLIRPEGIRQFNGEAMKRG